MASSNKSDKSNRNIQSQYTSGMTPSIITTINNTSPTLETENINNNVNTLTRSKRTNEPYESYIEDSFVGHWEREDDDINDEYRNEQGGETAHDGVDDDESALHPSTIEFDFDSFGPESFIYTPNPTTKTVVKSNIGNLKISSNEEMAQQILERSAQENTHECLDQQNRDQRQQQQEAPSVSSTQNSHETKMPRIPDPLPDDYLVDPAQIDLKVIEPYKKVISHAGYCHHFDPSAPAPKPGEPAPAIIVFSACYLPDRSRLDYNYVMDHLFLYVLASLHELIADDYILIYLHNTHPSNQASSASSTTTSSNMTDSSSTSSPEEVQPQNNLPTFTWMKRCYQMIDRKLRKNLKILYLVKPTFWLKTIVIMCKPFISAKFSKKLRFVENLEGLKKCLPVDKLTLPVSAQNI